MKKDIDFYEVYEYYSQPIWQNFYFRIFIIFFILFISSLIIFFIFKLLKKRKEKTLSAWDWALLELNKLDIKKYSTKEDFKNFYFKLTNIIKTYFYKRYDWHVLDKTDEELIVFLEKSDFNKELLENLKVIFNDSLYIKFAGQETLKTQAEKDLDIIKNIIKNTKILPKNY
ncbi:hypothetical protein GF385_01275 [Candidatus Dependentiae bacterium]|nr:hypothetical protein [Candidatus Dependentiae bacterium]